jgi:hypothetical protein
MRTLTGMGGLGNAQDLAELLRQMGRGPDTMLAHITPEEAQMLLESGGSGKINPQTGLPEFQPDYNYDVEAQEGGLYGDPYDIGFGTGEFAPPVQPADIQGMAPEQFERFTGQQPMFTGQGSLAPQDFQPFDPGSQRFADSFQPGNVPLQQEYVREGQIPMVTADAVERYNMGRGQLPAAPVAAAPAPQTQPVSPQQQQSFKEQYPMLSQVLRSNLFATGLASLPAALFAGQARREGRGAERELREMAAPIREQAEALRQQALSGGLTPQQARQQEARRASLRQSASQRGGTTGTQQAMIENTLARERSGLAQTNLENAMRQLNLANTLTEAAIRARLASDRNVNQSLQNIYTNLIRTATGQNANVQAQPPSQPEQVLREEPLVPRPTTAGGK